jgi:hypothetical protein
MSIVFVFSRLLVAMRFLLPKSILLALTTHSATAYKPWNGTIPDSVNEECRQVLSTDVDCPFVVGRQWVNDGYHLKEQVVESYCSSSCRSSLRQYVSDLTMACYNEDIWEESPGPQAALDFAMSMAETHVFLCVADESVAACFNMCSRS